MKVITFYEYQFNDKLVKEFYTSPSPRKGSFMVDSLENVFLSIYYMGEFKINKFGALTHYKNSEPVERIVLADGKLKYIMSYCPPEINYTTMIS